MPFSSMFRSEFCAYLLHVKLLYGLTEEDVASIKEKGAASVIVEDYAALHNAIQKRRGMLPVQFT